MSTQETTVPNAKRLLWAGFMAILAAGVGFALRGGIFGAWASEYGFTATQLGAIGGAGFSGFCFGIIIGGIVVDKIGYGKLVAVALLGHILSAFVTFGASTPQNAYDFLYWGMFIFAFANGTLEAVANPLVATIFPKQRTHYLNILHASWPLGMVVGALASYALGANGLGLGWKGQLSFYLVPTVAYAVMFMGQSFPKSEAAEKGADLGEMTKDIGILGGAVVCYLLTLFFAGALGLETATANIIGVILLIATAMISRLIKKPSLESLAAIAVCALIALQAQSALHLSNTAGLAITIALVMGLGLTMGWTFGSILLFVLFVTHAIVGAVELGTDSWIEAITGNLFTADEGKALFIWTSAIMFGLRFCAHFIETKLGLSPIGILLTSALLAFGGLQLASGMNSFGIALLALGIYALGKTFFWPTMLAVVGDRFPRSGAVAMSIMGGIGMLSAGLIGGPGLGYAKDRFTAEALQKEAPAVYAASKASSESKFLNLAPVTAVAGDKLEAAKKAGDKGTADQKAIVAANQAGDRATLKADSFLPLTMAAIYLMLLFYFKSIGGYRALKIEEQA
jgi:MFS family permease